MKTSFLMLDGLSQVVLTPECEAEAKMLGLLHRSGHTITVHSGEFRQTRGGYVREFGDMNRISGTPPADTMLVLRPAEPPAARIAIANAVKEAVLAEELTYLRASVVEDETEAVELARQFRTRLSDAAYAAAFNAAES